MQKPKSGKHADTVKRLLKEMTGKYKVALFLVFGFILGSTVANVAGSFFIQSLVDDYISPLLLSDNPIFTGLVKALLIMGSIYLTGVLCTFFYNRMMVTISQGVQKKIRDEMFAHMQKLPLRYFDTHTHGEIMSRYTNDIDTLRDFFAQSLPQMLSSLFTIIIVAIAMLALNLILSLFVFVFVVVMLFITQKIGKKAAANFIRQQQYIGELNGYIQEMIAGQKVIKVFCHEEETSRAFYLKNEKLRSQSSAANRLTNIVMPIMMNIGTLQYVVIALIGGAMALNGVSSITLGTIAAFLTLSKSFSGPISQISVQINSVIMALAGAGRIFDLMDEEAETDNGYVTLVNALLSKNGEITECDERTGFWAWKHPHSDGTLTYTEVKGDVRLFNVDFGYTEDKPVLNDVTLYAKPGQKIAFVGATGAGKTTITNLINRFYDIADGKIRFDGININKIRKSDLRRSLGIVLQDTHLFTGSVTDNIRYGKLDATPEEVRHAAQLAGAHEFIMSTPDGYDTVISGDGGNLSGGQRQLLAIARAAVLNPPVMIMDEATSSIDTRTEAIVQCGMDSLMRGRTVFVIAHRLSTVKNSDAIMVMEQGRIIERGSHSELIGAKGKYYQLYTGKFE